ncbi:hypothetical protein BGZ60DRAFT_522938 [Tricladium varicosporioides]|nr:hypothetical protein BGZ60DRAFT_522938 [Hymenoscyphus varicosporioides]
MHRYQRGPTSSASKASATTLCQKCLKKDMSIFTPFASTMLTMFLRHYSYECKAVAQERPYVSRPSRTQQLLNPKLVPKLTSDIPQDLLRKKGIANEQLAKAELERGRKRDRQSEELDSPGASKRIRSTSVSTMSVSTISTNMSRSPSPHQSHSESKSHRPRSPSLSRSPPKRSLITETDRFASDSRSPPPRPRAADWEKKRRRDSSSGQSFSLDDPKDIRRGSRERRGSRSTRRRFQHRSPSARGRKTESRSPQRGRRRLSNDHMSGRGDYRNENEGQQFRRQEQENRLATRERSLSPFSKRLAITQAMNMSR